MKRVFSVAVLIMMILLTAGCVLDTAQGSSSQAPTAVGVASQSMMSFQSAESLLPVGESAPSRVPCTIPAGWVLYQLPLNETIYSIALRGGVSGDELLRGNCLTAATEVNAGSWLYVPVEAARPPQTTLPLGISALIADPVTIPAGGFVNLTWQAQGPVVRVRLGWIYQNQFIEEATNLPASGTWPLQVPDDGRTSMTFAVRVSDGVQEVTAQTTVSIRCPETWFFGPSPSGCPSAPLITTFHEQPFERGVIVYIPALGRHFAFAINEPGVEIDDTFVPGMPLRDASLEGSIPSGLRQPTGPINYAWRSNKTLQTALGYAVGPEISYGGMMQRMAIASGEILYFSASNNQVYRFVNGQAWQVVTTQ